MAKKRDIIVGVFIAAGFLISVGIIGLVFIGMLSADGDYDFGGFGESSVGVIELFDVINETSGRQVIKQLDKWVDNNSIKAIVLHLNTPGGGVAISQEVYDAVLRMSEKKPVVAAMASVSASGGYYIACAADRIIANPGTITGSIGVIFQFQNYGELLDKIGINTETIKSGELKDVGNYSRAMTKKEELMLKSVVMDTYEQFITAVAEGRGMEREDIYPLADGSIFTGYQAMNLGLVDTLGGLKEAVELAAKLADIEGEPKIVRPYKRRKGSIFDLMEQILKNINKQFESKMGGPQLLYIYQ